MPSFGTVEAHPASFGKNSPGGIRADSYETASRLSVSGPRGFRTLICRCGTLPALGNG
jgi:hypothetical protein